MKANNLVFVRTLGFAALLALGACAKGASTFDDTANGGAGGSTTCGNGIMDPGEQCDPKLPTNMTCQTMTGGVGMVVCDPATCRYSTTMCSAGGGVAGHM
jgi:hypothetical protein